MRKFIIATAALAALTMGSAAANAQSATIGGAVVGAGTGAVIGGAVGGGNGAAAGAVIGGVTGAAVGANAEARYDRGYRRERVCFRDNFGRRHCRYR
jgi:hypothetical protein